jgi:fused signal recognition particle receptor
MAFGQKKSFFGKLQEKIENVIMQRPTIDEDTLDDLEEILIMSDIGMETSNHIISQLRENIKTNKLDSTQAVEDEIAHIVGELMDKGDRLKMIDEYPLVILMIGVNGGGKTTSIAKLASRYKNQGKKVLLGAADTFRAAAGEQLDIWAKRVDVDIIKHQEGADPSAVIFDAIQAAKARDVDVLICDTAGRLQNKKNLMLELEKMNKVITREFPDAAKETLLVLDATTGKNAVSQAEEFGKIADVTGLFITKLDGTSKGGIAITVSDEYDLPVKFIGIGERIKDIEEFDPYEYAKSIFSEDDE